MYSVTSVSTAIHVIAKRPLVALALVIAATGAYYTAVWYSKTHAAVVSAQPVKAAAPLGGLK